MTNNVSDNVLNQLFKIGITKDEFFAKYKELANANTSEEITSEETIFAMNLNENTLNVMFDTININKTDCEDNTLDESDIKALANMDGDETSISKDDINAVYEKMAERAKNSKMTTDAIDANDNTSITPTEGIVLFSSLKDIKQNIAQDKIRRLENDINNLVMNNTSISSELKAEFQALKSKIDQTKRALRAKQSELNARTNKARGLRENIEYKKGQIAGTQDENSRLSYENELGTLTNEYNTYADNTTLNNEIAELNRKLTSYSKDMKTVMKKIEKASGETAKKIESKQKEINNVETQLQQDLADIEAQESLAHQLLLMLRERMGRQNAQYGDIASGTVNDGHVGRNAAQALANATGEIGVREATGRNDGAAVAKYRGGVDNGAAWCASFVSWCYKGNDIFGYQAAVSGIRDEADAKGLYSKVNDYTPKPGDVMIQKNGCSHTGIVESVDPDGTVHTIEGNAGNSVKRCTYRPGTSAYAKISGWVRMSDTQQA